MVWLAVSTLVYRTKNAGEARPVVVVGNQSRYKSRPLNTTKVFITGVHDLLLNLPKEISYVSTRSEQIANANLSMYEALYAPSSTNIAIFYNKCTTVRLIIARHKYSHPPRYGKLSFNVFLDYFKALICSWESPVHSEMVATSMPLARSAMATSAFPSAFPSTFPSAFPSAFPII